VVAVAVGGSGPSLDLGKNNSTSPEPAETDRYDCRETFDDMFYRGPDGDTAEYRCGSWDCYCCGYRMRENLVEEIKRVTQERPGMSRLLTLTLDPETAPAAQGEQHKYLTERWNALRTRLKREVGDFSYIWVREEQGSGLPHLHALVSRYLPQGVVSRAWSELGGGEIVDIRQIDRVDKAAHYIGKYLTKDALTGMPDGIRRYGSSADIDLGVRDSGSDDEPSDWRLLKDDPITDVPRPVVRADFVRDEPPPEPD
jgi:hypothetical protein